MSVDKSFLSTEIQHDEPSQTANTQINNQDIKKDDLATATTPETSTTQGAPDSDVSKHATVNAVSSHDSDAKKHPTSVIPDTDANKQSDVVATTSQIPDSDVNKQANVIATQDSSKSFTTMVPTSNQDSNNVDQTNPPNATNQSTQTVSTNLQTNKDDHGNPLPTTESSTSQIPDSDANKKADVIGTHDSPKSSTTMVPTSNKDSNNVDQTNPPKATNHSTQIASTDLQTNKDDKRNPLPTTESSTSQIPDSDADKQADLIATHDSPKSSTTMVPASNQDPNSIDQTNPPTADSDTKQATKPSTETASTNLKTNKDADITPDDERNHLSNLINQELVFISEICPRLKNHEQRIKKEAEQATEKFQKLQNETCEIKDLKDLKKTVTKLKIQIPAKYKTSDKSDKQKKLESGIENTNIHPKLQKKMPLLQHKLFHQSSFCRTIQLRFNELSCQLKLCLLCFTVFPENAIISRRSMVYWWIGEGLTPQEEDLDGGKTAEDCANEFFKELMDKDFIEPAVSKSDNRYVAFCKMHPMVRASLVMIADKVMFFDFDEYGNPKDFGKFDEIVSPEDLPEIYPLGDQKDLFEFFDEKGQNISNPIEIFDSKRNRYQFAALDQELSDGKDDDTKKKPLVDREGKKIDTTKKYYLYRKKPITVKSFKVCLMGSGLSKGITWEKLHILFNVKDDMLEFKPEWFLRMKNINVVFLGRWQKWPAHHIEFDDFEFDKTLDHMNHVRFFSLQGVSRVSRLPDSISKLKTLLILDLRACHNLEDIPETIGTLKYLTHLDISECYLLKKVPKGIANLKSLQVFKGFVVVKPDQGRDTCTLEDLEKLENLRKLSTYTHMKDFPQESHLKTLHKFVALRKLTILWGGHESKEPETNNSIQEVVNKKKHNLASRVKRLMPRMKQRVGGSIRRMNAFRNSSLGSRLEKLDLKCFPHTCKPAWLTADNLQGLKKLYIRGGRFSDLGQYKDTVQWDDSAIPPKETWNVEILRLKYLEELNMEWRELHDLFPKLTSLEKVKCPKLTLFPCNELGVWNKKGTKTT